MTGRGETELSTCILSTGIRRGAAVRYNIRLISFSS